MTKFKPKLVTKITPAILAKIMTPLRPCPYCKKLIPDDSKCCPYELPVRHLPEGWQIEVTKETDV